MVNLVRRENGLLYRQGGLLVRATAASLAAYQECCCGEVCCCEQFDAVPLPDITFTLAGYLTGSVTITGQVSDVCGIWQDDLPLDADKCEFESEVTVTMQCTGGGIGAIDVQMAGGLAECGIDTLELVSRTCDDGTGKFRAVYNWTVTDLTGSCACPDETGTLTLQEV